MSASPVNATRRTPTAERDAPRHKGTPLPDGIPTPAYLAAIRASVPSRTCAVCGDAIGAARLTLQPQATTCAWCAPPRDQANAIPKSSPAAMSANGPMSR
ncbi:hypothetical protein DFR24_1044 [Panacagrimonas perspica]|uniref:Zinc finger DksA/TraR C4-type domain-containing protein n=1 Tax=Panacagrimonas perspica TaxID=381431 RepID=A0A4R7PCB7_9GAMM|nr:hypothetical protein DFR24_1044 [Panacagrimonas perspica]